MPLAQHELSSPPLLWGPAGLVTRLEPLDIPIISAFEHSCNLLFWPKHQPAYASTPRRPHPPFTIFLAPSDTWACGILQFSIESCFSSQVLFSGLVTSLRCVLGCCCYSREVKLQIHTDNRQLCLVHEFWSLQLFAVLVTKLSCRCHWLSLRQPDLLVNLRCRSLYEESRSISL